MCVACLREPCVHSERQRTFGELVGLPDEVPVQDDLRECPVCGESTRHGLVEDCNGVEVCNDCFGQSSYHCEGCGEVGELDYSCSDDDTGELLCDDCYSQRFATCYCCDGAVRIGSDEHHQTDSGVHYHSECYWENHSTCDRCGCECHNDDLYYNERTDQSCCSDCHERCRNGSCKAKKFTPTGECKRTGSLRTFGVELETDVCDDYADLDGETHFTAKDDGSIDGKEFVSRVLSGDAGLEAIEHFCHHANRLGFDVDDSCGFHVHFGVDDLDDDSMYAVMLAYRYCEDAWYAMVDGDRAENTYCGPLGWQPSHRGSWEDILDSETDRYKWLNVRAYYEHGTIEVRLHGGTLDAGIITKWVCGHLRFIQHFAGWSPDEVKEHFRRCSVQDQFNAMCEAWGDHELCKHFQSKALRNSGEAFTVPETVQV